MGSRDHSYDCDVCGFARGGMNDLVCMCDAWKEAAACALLTLAFNLAVGAALCEADRRGYERCAAYPVSAECWFKPGHALEPGCGRPSESP